jgi:hypothetical protein
MPVCAGGQECQVHRGPGGGLARVGGVPRVPGPQAWPPRGKWRPYTAQHAVYHHAAPHSRASPTPTTHQRASSGGNGQLNGGSSLPSAMSWLGRGTSEPTCLTCSHPRGTDAGFLSCKACGSTYHAKCAAMEGAVEGGSGGSNGSIHDGGAKGDPKPRCKVCNTGAHLVPAPAGAVFKVPWSPAAEGKGSAMVSQKPPPPSTATLGPHACMILGLLRMVLHTARHVSPCAHRTWTARRGRRRPSPAGPGQGGLRLWGRRGRVASGGSRPRRARASTAGSAGDTTRRGNG